MRLRLLQVIHSTNIPKKQEQMVDTFRRQRRACPHHRPVPRGSRPRDAVPRRLAAPRARPATLPVIIINVNCARGRGRQAHGFSLDLRRCEYAVCGLGGRGARAEGGVVEDVVHPVVVALVTRKREGARGDLVDLVCARSARCAGGREGVGRTARIVVLGHALRRRALLRTASASEVEEER